MDHEMFARRLREAMAQRGMKQVDVVRAAEERGQKLGKSQVSQYVSGKVLPRKDVLELLADILGVPAAQLCADEPDAEADAASEAAVVAEEPVAATDDAADAPPGAVAPAETAGQTEEPSARTARDHDTNPQHQRSGNMREFKNRPSSTTSCTMFAARWPTRRTAWKRRARTS